MPPLADAVFPELLGLDRNLPLHLHLCGDGTRLPGLHVCGYIQTSAARHPAAYTVPGAAGLPEGEMARQYYSVFYRHYIELYLKLSWPCVSVSLVCMSFSSSLLMTCSNALFYLTKSPVHSLFITGN